MKEHVQYNKTREIERWQEGGWVLPQEKFAESEQLQQDDKDGGDEI